MTVAKFRNINRLFVVLFKNGNDDPTRNSFNKYYMLLVEIKFFNTLFKNKPFFDQPLKNKQKSVSKMYWNVTSDDYTTGNLLDFLYYQNYYKLLGMDLSRQTNTSVRQQITFTGELQDDGTAIFFVSER